MLRRFTVKVCKMALPALGKCVLFLVIVLLTYAGYAFRIRDGGILASSEQPHVTCNLMTGKCPDNSAVSLNLLYKKYQSLGPRGKLAKVQPLPMETKDRMFGRTEKLATVRVAYGLRKLKVSRFEMSTSEEKDEDAGAVPDSLRLNSKDEEDNAEEIEAEPEKTSNDDNIENGADKFKDEEQKDNDSEEGNDEDEVTVEVESDKEDDDDQENEDQVTTKKEIIDNGNDDNSNEVAGRKNFFDDNFEQKIHKHSFKLKGTHLLKKLRESENLNTDQISSSDNNLVKKILNKKEIEIKVSYESEVDTKVDDDQDNENLKDYNTENNDNEYDKDKSIENVEENEQALLILAPRKLEKVRLADKEKAKSTVPFTLKPVISADKPYDVHILNNNLKELETLNSTMISELEKPESKQTAKVEKKVNESKKEDRSKSVSKSPSTLEKKSTFSEQSKNRADTKKPIRTENKNTKSKKSNNQRETSLTLAELNDELLHVPSFVPNFTAVNDPICQQHGKIFLRQLRGFKFWALQMLDSSGKIPSSLLRGNVNQLGDFDQCLGIGTRVKVENMTMKVQGKYCLATMDLHAAHSDMKRPINLMQSRGFIRGTMRDPGHFIPRFTTLNWALCLPAACSAADARKSIEGALKSYNMTSGIKFSINVEPGMCYVRQKPQAYTKETIGVLYLYASVLCLVLIATVRDCISSVQEKGNYSERIIMSFSLKRTIKSLFCEYSSGSGEITCIHGIRSLATMALYIAHKLIPLSRIPYANRVALTEIANTPISSILRVSLVYTDSFLLLSGVLTAYSMAKELKTRGEIRWFCRFVARFVRLTPALIAIVFWYAFVMEHTGTGPQWNSIIKVNADICKKNAWTNLLYIQNFFPFEEMCATHTHQLALDMQLSLIVPMLVFFLEMKPVIGILSIFFLLQLSATLRYLATVNNKLSLVIFHGMTLKHLYKTANSTYILPLHRATPYLFGVGLGVLMNYTGRSIKLHKVFSILGWSIASCLGCWSLFSPWKYARRDFTYDVEDAAYYAVISPVSSALALSWTIFACFTNHGGAVNRILSNYWLLIFSRISYAIYLSQFAVFFYNIGTTRYSSEFQIHRAIDPFETMLVVAVSTALTLLFDIPLQEVKNVMMECTGGLRTAEIPEQAVKEKVERKVQDFTPKDEPKIVYEDIKSYDEDEEEEPKRWNWQKGTFRELVTHQANENMERNLVTPTRLKRQNARRQSLIRMDHIDRLGAPWNLIDGDETGRRSRSSHRTLTNDPEAGDDYLSPDIHSQAKNDTEQKKNDYFIPGMIRRERSSPSRTSHMEEVPSWETAGNKRGEDWQNFRSSRSLSRNAEARLLSSESEDDDYTRPRSRRKLQEPRMNYEEDWELHIHRQSFHEKNVVHKEEEIHDDRRDFTRRRSSAEGKMALLRDPVGKEMTFWTISKVSQLGSSQEPSDLEDDELYMRIGKDEESSFSETPSEEESSREPSQRRSLTSRSQLSSVEDDESVAFILRKDDKRISIQDLSKLSQEEDEVESGWNMVKGLDTEIARSSSGLFKRQSIIKSQASEEDPEYLLPERPKLVEQEQEHPFKKAWQEQKSRSEEDSYVVKETKENKENKEFKETKDADAKEIKQHSGERSEGAQAREMVHLTDNRFAITCESVSGNSESLNSRSPAEEEKYDWPNEE